MVFLPILVLILTVSTVFATSGAFPFFNVSSRSSLARCFVLLARQPRFAHSSSIRRTLFLFRSEANSISSLLAFSSRKPEYPASYP